MKRNITIAIVAIIVVAVAGVIYWLSSSRQSATTANFSPAATVTVEVHAPFEGTVNPFSNAYKNPF